MLWHNHPWNTHYVQLLVTSTRPENMLNDCSGPIIGREQLIGSNSTAIAGSFFVYILIASYLGL